MRGSREAAGARYAIPSETERTIRWSKRVRRLAGVLEDGVVTVTRPEKREVTVGASRCLCCQIQPIPSPDLDPAGTSGRSPRRDVLARDFARDHCVGCGGGDRGGEMLMDG